MAKPSPFQALVDRQLDDSTVDEAEQTTVQAPVQPIAQPTGQATAQARERAGDRVGDQRADQSGGQSGDRSLSHKGPGKSSNPEYQRLTVYLRRDTILDLKRRIVGTNVELSDIVQDAVDRWIQHNERTRSTT